MHLNQVHKETLSQVENALPNRQGLDVEIFGMEGIPQDILDQHRNRIIQNFYQAQEDRRIATGNPLPGQSNSSPRKKVKVETKEELLARLAEWRAQKKAKKEAPAVANGAADGRPAADAVPGQFVSIAAVGSYLSVLPFVLTLHSEHPSPAGHDGFRAASYAGPLSARTIPVPICRRGAAVAASRCDWGGSRTAASARPWREPQRRSQAADGRH